MPGTRNLDAIICDGAVRSGKTTALSLGFVFWASARFSGRCFAICGKTATAVQRNIIRPLSAQLTALGFRVEEKVSKSYLDIRLGAHTNRFYWFGGRDESSAALIQGMTLAGVLLDEVALMPRSFVEQALARCSVPGSKMWFSCNPDNPAHWFYREWILQAGKKRALYLHFTMADNLSLSPDIRRRYERLYTGTFYDRFVRGIWAVPHGLVYQGFDPALHVAEPDGTPERFVISCDYGTRNPTSLGLWGYYRGCWYRLRESYYDARKTGISRTDEEHYAALCTLAGGLPIDRVVADPSAASFIECIRRHGKYRVTAAGNDVLSGIHKVADALRSGNIKIAPCCADALREFGLYAWDESAARDKPLKENDHAMDDIRYFVATVLCARPDPFFAVSVKRNS